MKDQLTEPVTFSLFKIWIPIGILLVSTGIAWGSVLGSINLTNAKIDTLLSQNSRMGQRISTISDKQIQMSIDIAKLQQIIQDAQAQGLLSNKITPTDIPGTIASAMPGIIPPQDITYDASYTAGQSAELEPTPTFQPLPTLIPQRNPTPEPTSAPVGLSSAVLGILGL